MDRKIIAGLAVFTALFLVGCILNGQPPVPTPTPVPTPLNATPTPISQFTPVIVTQNLSGVLDIPIYGIDDGADFTLPSPK